jgi:hypothetical protein
MASRPPTVVTPLKSPAKVAATSQHATQPKAVAPRKTVTAAMRISPEPAPARDLASSADFSMLGEEVAEVQDGTKAEVGEEEEGKEEAFNAEACKGAVDDEDQKEALACWRDAIGAKSGAATEKMQVFPSAVVKSLGERWAQKRKKEAGESAQQARTVPAGAPSGEIGAPKSKMACFLDCNSSTSMMLALKNFMSGLLREHLLSFYTWTFDDATRMKEFGNATTPKAAFVYALKNKDFQQMMNKNYVFYKEYLSMDTGKLKVEYVL